MSSIKSKPILIGCEESQAVCKAFRELGHEAYSCDLQECSGGHPEWHLQMDVFDAITGGELVTQSGEAVSVDKWHMGIFFPPCTYLTTTANRSFVSNPERWKKRLEAMMFVWRLWTCKIPRIAIENPKGVISTHIRKPDQYIQPYEFGHPDSKMTGLWLINLPLITPFDIVEPEYVIDSKGKRYSKTHWSTPSTNNKENSKLRSKTYPGIARAMAEQWSTQLK